MNTDQEKPKLNITTFVQLDEKYKKYNMRFFLLIMVMVVISCKPDTSSKSGDNTTSANQERQAAPVDNNNGATPGQNKTNTALSNKGQSAKSRKSNGNSATASTRSTLNKAGIPDACSLMSTKTIGRYVNQPAENIFASDGSSLKSPKARACFFKWDGSAIANAGVMIQVQKNPVEEDVPEYFTYLIASRKTDGEKDPSSESVIKYKDWPGFGDDGAYSTEAGKYIWRIGNEWAFMIAFNTELPPNAQKVAAEAFAQEAMSNMTF